MKAGLLPGSRAALAAKVNVNLPGNFEKRQLPTIQGALLLADTITGRPLAVMDSMTLTAIRTAATAMLAAGFGARKDSKDRGDHRVRNARPLSGRRTQGRVSG